MLKKRISLRFRWVLKDSQHQMAGLKDLNHAKNIKFARTHGEKAAANFAGGEVWINNVLPRETQWYAARDIFNADETELIYSALQSGILLFEGDRPAGGNVPTERLTALVSVNMDGTNKRSLDYWQI